jgi:NAD(P)-dependent dehydrogenase (short-subunit alcohol dehydrogenase family)
MTQRNESVKFPQRFESRVAIVTGAGSRGNGIGNGRAIAMTLAREGADVVLVDMNREWALVTEEMITAESTKTGGAYGRCLVLQADVSKEADCQQIVDQTLDAFGRIDVLVNNVGLMGPKGTAVEVDPDEWDRIMRINVKSVMLMSKFCIPVFRKHGKGAIVNISSIAGIRGGHENLLYPTSKGALVNMTQSMAAHHGPEGIRVNAVAPGLVYTPMVGGEGMPAELRENRQRQSLLQTEGTGWDVAKAVAFLASEDARWITGVILPVDAGLTSSLLINFVSSSG